MKSRIFKFAAFGSCLALAASMALAFGEQAFVHNIVHQTSFIRRTATEEQRRAGERNKKEAFREITPAIRAELIKKNIRSVLVPTVRSPKTPKKIVDIRLRYSLEGEVLIDDNAYESPTPLQPGTIARTNGVEQNYVGL